ncbi:uncharacterized protein QC763_0035600 [Podospora pseudopauciseta]|uniref:Uncharacterized protein n=2 Tax=Podospora TaxID=5144 RepID=A0ABR0HNS3_9PEZI|nr:hypothetical protein QC763_0035600 [Podospora pseudopauciseta]KAK4679606.1 hypothetical protein QC764_0036480 [Podospora pseudoanserina]
MINPDGSIWYQGGRESGCGLVVKLQCGKAVFVVDGRAPTQLPQQLPQAAPSFVVACRRASNSDATVIAHDRTQ